MISWRLGGVCFLDDPLWKKRICQRWTFRSLRAEAQEIWRLSCEKGELFWDDRISKQVPSNED
jgi:hypothetical protein